jgi:transposase InsO family protein
MRQEHPTYSIDVLCRLFGKSRQAYYEHIRYVCVNNREYELILSFVRAARKDFPRMGCRKLLIYLQPKFEAMNIRTGRDAFYGLLYDNFMLVRHIRNRRKTTCSSHWMHKYPNLAAGNTPDAPNRLWVSDITYIEIEGSFCYLSLITDAYSHKIVGWHPGQSLRSCNTIAALKMALSGIKGKHPELIHHSDRGSQYCCGSYVNMLTRRQIQISMTQSGNPRENAIAERINGILKTEWLYDNKPGSWQECVSIVGKIIDLYNNQRPHQSIGYMVPAEVHQTGVKTERKWKSYYRKSNLSDENVNEQNRD